MENQEQELRYIPLEELNETEDEEWNHLCIQRNQFFLDKFWDDMAEQKLSRQTVNKHYSNADVFLDMLYTREGFPMEEALENIDCFMGNWYIRRCLWSKPNNMKSTAASIKKFAKSMLDHGYIDKSIYDHVVNEIKTLMPEWIEKCAEYNNNEMDTDGLYHMFGGYGW